MFDHLDAAKIWDVAAGRLKDCNANLYEQWFRLLLPLDIENGKLKLGVADDFFASIIADEYGDLLVSALRDIEGVSYGYCFEAGHEAPALPPSASVPAPSQERREPALVRRPGPQNCLAEHTFENFVVGAENRHAFAAAKTAAENPGLYNPLYLFGDSGVGKTHLLQAVATAMHREDPSLVIRYAPCDELLNDFYNLLQQKSSLKDFRESVRSVDVLLVDDVHSLAKKPQMQEEFFNMFNTLYNQRKQIILTSDKHPCEIHDLDKRLETRFESGMTAEIGAPEFEARLAILRMMRNDVLSKVPLSDEILEFLAQNISSSVRRLKGAFIRLAGYASMSGNDKLTIELAEDLLHSQLAQESAVLDISMDRIQSAVAGHYGLPLSDLLGVKRNRGVAEPRMIAMYLCRELTKNSSTEVGAAFSRNHATVLHAEKKVPELCRENETIRRSITQLKRQLQHK